MLDKIKIRPVSSKDLDTLKQLYTQIDEQHWQAEPSIFKKPHDEARTREHLEALLGNGNQLITLAETNDEICGYLLCRLIDFETPVHKPVKIAHVSELIVKESYFGQGIAQLLMAEVRRWATEHQATKIDLNVYAFNKRAIRFYEKEGLTPERFTMSMHL